MHRGAHLTTRLLGCLLLVAGLLPHVWGASAPATPGAPSKVTASGVPDDDAGTTLVIKWKAPAAKAPGGTELVGYQVLLAEPAGVSLMRRLSGKGIKDADGSFKPRATVGPEETEAPVEGLNPSTPYQVKVAALYAPAGVRWYSPADGQPVLAKASKSTPGELTVDRTGTLEVAWDAPKHKAGVTGAPELVGYQVFVARNGEAYTLAASAGPDDTSVSLAKLPPGRKVRVQVTALYAEPKKEWFAPGEEAPTAATVVESQVTGPVSPTGRWFGAGKTNVLVGIVLYGVIVALCFGIARRRDMYVRPIAGLEAVDDAIGRATEMGKPILYVAGLSGLGEVTTIASVLVLGHLARKTAAYETPILVPCFDPLVMTAEREIVRESYLEAGRPQAYRPDNIFYVTDSQFGYVAAVDGIMLREKPAANFFMGAFAAESLILAETGNMTGAVQVAGTDSDTQIPFFITACDYTLMGEELYAAGAYLSRHPSLLAQLKAQDIGKAIILTLTVLATVAITLGYVTESKAVYETVLKWFASSG